MRSATSVVANNLPTSPETLLTPYWRECLAMSLVPAIPPVAVFELGPRLLRIGRRPCDKAEMIENLIKLWSFGAFPWRPEPNIGETR